MNELKTLVGKIKGYGLVRDKDGRPLFDDASNIPKPIWDMLTKAEQEEIINGRHTSR